MHRLALRVLAKGLSAAIFTLEVVGDLTPLVRLTGRRRLPQNMAPGTLGAEVGTWAAVSPSLLPRPWWVTAANVSLGQGVGHFAAASLAFALKRTFRRYAVRPQDRIPYRLLHAVIGTGTVIVAAKSFRNQEAQARLVNKENERGPRQAARGIALGTLGYGALLIVGEAVQATTTQISRRAQRFVPRWVAWPLALAALSATMLALSDRVVWRRFIRNASLRAERLNRLIFPDSMMPWEPERSGSPWSLEPWTAIGAQGRRFVTRGPRAHDIARVMDYDHAHEPIRIFAGLVPGRDFYGSAQQVIAEMERTGAFRRDTIVIQMPAGSGWLNNYSTSAYEFLTRGDCATVTMQYSYLPSVFAFVVDRDAPIAAARILLEMVAARMTSLPDDDRPRLYLAGESLGAFALVENFDALEDLLAACDGAVFTGPPRMTHFFRRLTLARDRGSLERLPRLDGGRHVRYASNPAHLRADAFGADYPRAWQRPRVVVAQHASDAIVWWDQQLAWRRPDWLREAVPPTLHADAFRHLHWVPIITWWQVALDQLNSLNVPGGHGHNYFEETFWYWDAVLGSQVRVSLDRDTAVRMHDFIRATQAHG